MPRKLKTYITSIGFYDLAVAAPSMKAALEAWGVRRNLFQESSAEETDDPKIVAATMAQPGTVLRRAVGTNGKFEVDAAPPTSLPANAKPARKAKKKAKSARRTRPLQAISPNQQKAKIIQFEAAKARRDAARAREEEARSKQERAASRDQERRDKATEKKRAGLERARRKHEARLQKLEKALTAAQRKVDAENERWKAEEQKLESAVRKTRR
jgi:hypothetical protein